MGGERVGGERLGRVGMEYNVCLFPSDAIVQQVFDELGLQYDDEVCACTFC